jgi:hypothetical protein
MVFKFAGALALSVSGWSCAQVNSATGKKPGNYLDVGKVKLYFEQCGASGSRFFVRTTGTEFQFEKDGSGRATQFVIFTTDGNIIKPPRL